MNNYFPHDSNARNSDKLIPLRARFGAEGYGIYFMLIERLREEPTYMSIKDYNMLAFDLRVDSGKVKSVIEDFGLFAFTDDGKCFYSESLMRRMKVKEEKSKKAKQSAQLRWKDKSQKSDKNANAQETDANAPKNECERIANAQETDAIKVKESKVNNSPPLRVREEELLQKFDGFAKEILDGGFPIWQDRIKCKYHIADMKDAVLRFRQYAIETVLLEKIKDTEDFQRFFVWRINEFLNNANENDRRNAKRRNSGKGYTTPDCGLHEGKRE